MPTFAAVPDAQEIEALIGAAWETYSYELRELTGQEYADAETDSWERLQATLRELEALRAELRAPR